MVFTFPSRKMQELGRRNLIEQKAEPTFYTGDEAALQLPWTSHGWSDLDGAAEWTQSPSATCLPAAPDRPPMILPTIVLWCQLYPRLFGALREHGRPQMTPRRPVSRWVQQLESNPRQPAGGWSSRGATPDGQQVERAAGGQHHFVLNLTLITLVGILCGS